MMYDFIVSYYLGDMYHAYTIEAQSKTNAMQKALKSILNKDIMHEFKVERRYANWN